MTIAVTITKPFMPYFKAARRQAKSIIPNAVTDEKARFIMRFIERLIRKQFSTFDGHESQPLEVRDISISEDGNFITFTVTFDNRDAAILFKLTHGGET